MSGNGFGALKAPFGVVEISDVLLAFPAGTGFEALVPSLEDIPDEFNVGRSGWRSLGTELALGMVYQSSVHLSGPKDDVDPEKAWRHIEAIMGSYALKIEHKISAISFLLSIWFERAEWRGFSGDVESTDGEFRIFNR